MKEIRKDPDVRRLAEIRAEEISNGTKRLEELSQLDQEECWNAAEDEAIALAEHAYDRQIERTA